MLSSSGCPREYPTINFTRNVAMLEISESPGNSRFCKNLITGSPNNQSVISVISVLATDPASLNLIMHVLNTPLNNILNSPSKGSLWGANTIPHL